MNQQPGVPPLVLAGPPDGEVPLRLGPRVTLYVCGITPYDAAHVGHAFTYVAFDTLTRFLRARGHEVAYCQNVTDVDDDVLRRAARDGEDYLELGRRETAAYLRDMDALNVARPTFFPKATEEIPAMVELAGQLVDGGNAYVVDGTVFFDVTSYPGFGELSGLSPAEQRDLLAERGGDPDDPRKRHPLDFVVWQRSQPGEPWWDSPWGRGRPGWHLECSAMSRHYLGVTIDLHGGGADLLYPHHESERAQSESANQAPFARRWLHTGMVRYQGEKMSKSLGNLVFPRDLFRDHEPAAVRLALLAHHWRSAWEWDPAELKEAAERLSAWRQASREAGPEGCGEPPSPSGAFGYPPVRGPQEPGVGAEGRPGVGAGARPPGGRRRRPRTPTRPGAGPGGRRSSRPRPRPPPAAARHWSDPTAPGGAPRAAGPASTGPRRWC
jgi:L-cysteine:1D-myo-inositol 2-amino-2-deoxy-alpha-D-glucopyranoside ligase